MQTIKSREIPVGELFSNLQLEWISYYLRQNIYNRESDKKMFSDICIKKRERIEMFERRNCMPSIFTNKGKFKKYLYEKFLNPNGLPNFQYTPKTEKLFTLWDSIHYFSVGSLIDFNGKEFTVIKVFPNKKQVEIKLEGESVIVGFEQIKKNIDIIFKDYI